MYGLHWSGLNQALDFGHAGLGNIIHVPNKIRSMHYFMFITLLDNYRWEFSSECKGLGTKISSNPNCEFANSPEKITTKDACCKACRNQNGCYSIYWKDEKEKCTLRCGWQRSPLPCCTVRDIIRPGCIKTNNG